MEPRFLLDTHIAVRWVTEPKRLSREQLRALEAARRRNEPFVLSAMSLVEIALLTSAGKLRLKATLNDFFAQLQGSPEFTVLPLTYDIALEVAALDSHLRDPADRIIVATARVHRLRLVTSDQRIIESKLATAVD